MIGHDDFLGLGYSNTAPLSATADMEDVPLIGDYCGAWDGDFNYCAGGGDSQRPAAVTIFERL